MYNRGVQHFQDKERLGHFEINGHERFAKGSSQDVDHQTIMWVTKWQFRWLCHRLGQEDIPAPFGGFALAF